MPSVAPCLRHPSINPSTVYPPVMNEVATLMMTFGCTLIDGGGECWLYAYIPTNFCPCLSTAAAPTSSASVKARALPEPSALHLGHSHHPPPSEGSTETESRAGLRANCSRAS